MVCNTYVQLDCDAAPGAATIEGQHPGRRAGHPASSRGSRATPQLVRRTPAQIADCGRGLLPRQHPDARRAAWSAGRATAHAACRGDFALYDSTRPYELRFDRPFEQYVLMLPGPTLARCSCASTEQLTASTVQRRARRRPPDDRHDPHARRRHRRAGARLGRGGGRERRRTSWSPGCQRCRRRASRRRSHLTALSPRADQGLRAARLRDPGPDRRGASRRELRFSVSTLHRAFADQQCTIAEWIWAQRLDAASHADLVDPTCAHRTISDIAFSWGFMRRRRTSAGRSAPGSAATAREVRAGAPRTAAATGRRRSPGRGGPGVWSTLMPVSGRPSSL